MERFKRRFLKLGFPPEFILAKAGTGMTKGADFKTYIQKTFSIGITEGTK